MYEIIFSDLALKQLKKIERATNERIIHALERIRINPTAHVKKLVGEPDYSFRVGDYRIILTIDQGKLVIFVIKVGHRSTIYD